MKKIFIFTVLMIFSLTAFGANYKYDEGGSSESSSTSSSSSNSGVESWYTYWGLGFGYTKYDDNLQDVIDKLYDNQVNVGLDLLGFYWPVNQNMMAGFIINTIGDSYESKYGGVEMSIYNYLYAASLMNFFGSKIGDGFFVRGDVGFAKASLTIKGDDVERETSSKWGFGIDAGIGYALPVFHDTSLMFSLIGSYRNIKDTEDSINPMNIHIMFGGLW